MRSGNGCVTWQGYNKPESILYGDGRRARMEYTPLEQLAMVKGWLGETGIERDSYGAPVCITDHKVLGGNPIGYIDANGKFPETQDEMCREILEYYFGGLKDVFDNKRDSFSKDIQQKCEKAK